MIYFLSQTEVSLLFRQNPNTAHKGGFQALLVQLQRRTQARTGRIFLMPRDISRIRRYAFGYGNGGWENRLTRIFGRILGPNWFTPNHSPIQPPLPLAA